MPYSIFPNQAPQNSAGMSFSIFNPTPPSIVITPPPAMVWVPTPSPTPFIDSLYGSTHTTPTNGRWERR